MTNYLPPTRLFSPPFGSPFHSPSYPSSSPSYHPASPISSADSPSYHSSPVHSSFHSPSNPIPETSFYHTKPSFHTRSPSSYDLSDESSTYYRSPFSSKSKSKAPIVSSPYRAPYEGDSDDEEGSSSAPPLSTVATTSPSYHAKLPPKSPNRFVAPEIDSDDDQGDTTEFTEASLNMHGSFLPTERYEDFEASDSYLKQERTHEEDFDREFGHHNPTSAIAPYPFSFSTYDTYLKSPLRSPSQWDDDYRVTQDRSTVPPSPSHLVSPGLHYLLDDLTISPKRSIEPIPATAPIPAPRTMLSSYQAIARAIQEESAIELRHAIDESAVAIESLKLSRKAQSYKNQNKLKEEEASKELSYHKAMTNIFNHKSTMERQIRERIELEQIRKQEAERKRIEDERLRLEALERKKKEEEIQKKEAEKKQQEEEERRKREEEERRKREEEERKRKEELEKKKIEDERKQREEAERKRIEQEKNLIEEQERKRLEEEARKQEEAKKAAEPISTPAGNPISTLPSIDLTSTALTEEKKEAKKYISPSAAEELSSISRHYNTIFQSIQSLDADPAFKDTKRRITMDINVKIGQLCPDSAIVKARTSDLLQLCQDAAGQGEPVQLFCLNLLSVKIMRQTALVEKPQSVFPVAIMAVSLMQKLPALEKILVAKFYEYCPYTVPRYAIRNSGQSDFDYKKSMGYSQIEDSPPRLEDDSAFYSRMEGAVRLYAAIIQTPCVSGTHPHGPSHGWAWLARLANLPPSDITATILRVFLEIAGHELLKVYRIQFHKLLVYFASDFVPKCPKTRRSDHDRLVKYLDSYLHTGTLNPPQGRDLE